MIPIPDTPFYAKMRKGHYIRTGHELSGYLTVSGDASDKMLSSLMSI